MNDFNPDRSIGRWISISYRLLTRILNRRFEPMELNSTQALFLIVLFFHDGLSQETLSTSLQIDKANTARALSKLEMMGLVRRHIAPHDRRTKLVHITDRARTLQPAFFAIFNRMTDIVSERFSQEEQDVFIQMLARFVDCLIEQIAQDEGKEKSDICREMCPAQKKDCVYWHPWRELGAD